MSINALKKFYKPVKRIPVTQGRFQRLGGRGGLIVTIFTKLIITNTKQQFLQHEIQVFFT